jgi:hypothetical protein
VSDDGNSDNDIDRNIDDNDGNTATRLTDRRASNDPASMLRVIFSKTAMNQHHR